MIKLTQGGIKMKKFINKNKNTVIFVGILVLLLIGLIILGACLTKKPLKEITYQEYTELKEEGKEFIVYFGETDSTAYNNVLEVVKTSNLSSYFVNTEDLTDNQKKETLDKETTSLAIYENKKKTYSYEDKTYKDYKLLQGLMKKGAIERKYIEVSIDEYLEIIKSEGYHFMFIGSNQCSYCTMFKQSINEALKEKEFNVYYVDLAREDITEKQREQLYKSDKYFDEEDWGTPLNFLYKDGKRIDVLSGYVDTNELISFLQKNKVVE